ncbi:MAG: FAD-dependent monooxygenase [Alphaproteobacteria bacterium]|nr:FAD-dependent monooxygenase [Alphaproteobacteria bacterium]
MRIGIIGCGVAGQAAAIALSRAGHAVDVFERFATARPLGAGLLLQPSGLAVLERLGLRQAAESFGAPVHRIDGRIPSGRCVFDLRYPQGQHGLGIHRGALFQLLHDAMGAAGAALHLDFEVESIDALARPIVVSKAGKREGPFDLLIDCAGAHDRLRDGLGLKVRAPLYPWGALWTACPDRDGGFAGTLHQMYKRAHTMMGILPIGRRPGGDEQLVAFFWSLKLEDFEAQRAAGLDVLKQRALDVWPEAGPIVREIERFEDFSLASYRDVSIRPYRKGRVLVIGDAAHGTSPQLGQGANLALIDALMLAYHLTDEDTDRALAAFERARKPHVDFYRLASRGLTPMFQSDGVFLPWARDTFLRGANWLPAGRHVMGTTLSGTRKLPLGLWRPPPSRD